MLYTYAIMHNIMLLCFIHNMYVFKMLFIFPRFESDYTTMPQQKMENMERKKSAEPVQRAELALSSFYFKKINIILIIFHLITISFLPLLSKPQNIFPPEIAYSRNLQKAPSTQNLCLLVFLQSITPKNIQANH